jgi:hypothetical protein
MRLPDPADGFVVRIEELRPRLSALAGMDPQEGLTDPDPQTGERWEWAQIWSHMVEFIPYWRGQLDRIREADADEPVPFGRVKTDPDSLARIEEGRRVPLPELWEALQEEIGHLKAFVAELSEDDWRRQGVHPTLGVMDVERIVDRFLTSHLEEHANQLEGLR